MKKVLFAIVFPIALISFLGCSGESGIIDNPDASLPDSDIDDDANSCPVESQCGTECCTADQECVLGHCDAICDTVRCRGICCSENEECVNNMQCLTKCLTVRCGENFTTCCPSDTICLDGVACAADCGEDEHLCGENLDFCCPVGTVCLNNSCIIPSGTCTNNFDCPDDTFYCEESIGQCLPLPSGPLCEGEPQFTDINPVLEWYWPGINYNGHYYQHILASPVVGDVDGDGIPEVVVVAYHDSTYSTDSIVVVLNGAGDGAGNPEVLFTIPGTADPSAPLAYGLSSVALANFDSDPGLEIVYVSTNGVIRIEDNDGSGTVCDSTNYPGCAGSRNVGTANRTANGMAIADVDHDGMPDIISLGVVLNGHDISNAGMDFLNTPMHYNTVVADLNEDGNYEIISASHAYTIPGGANLWTTPNGVTDGFVAVADILPDATGPEVINISNSLSIINGLTGEVLVGNGGSIYNQTIPIPGSGHGGAPTVADFDGDGMPEISTAGSANYVVYDPDCTNPPVRTGGVCSSGNENFILWTTATQDLSSSVTGSSVFDFQGDGAAEVLYNDECFFHIYDGLTGMELVDPIIPSSSRTYAEYPLVADVDGDGNAEMVVISNGDQAIVRDNCHISWKNAGVSIDELCQITNCTAGPACTGGVGGTCNGSGYQCDSAGICQLPGGTHGVRIFGDSGDMWVRTRTIWPQFSYHVTDVELSQGVWITPANELQSWNSYNNYRQNVQGGALFPVPDLTLELTAVAICPDEVRLTATVTNIGSAGTDAGIPVTFYRTDVSPAIELGTVYTAATILPGGWERVNFILSNPDIDTDLTFSATVNSETLVEECNDGNNESGAGPVRCISIE